MHKQNRVLITGGAGFIGSHLVDQFVGRGRAVTVLDNFSTGCKKNLEQAQNTGDVRIIEGSVLNLETIDRAMIDCDVVYHMAVECVRRSLSKPIENHHANASGTINTLEIAKRREIKRFIYCSSSEVYGNCPDSFLNETRSRCEPTTVYGASKLAGEYYTKAYYYTYQLPTVIVRPFNAYGPRSYDQGERAEVIPRFVIRLLNNLPPIIFGTGLSARDFTYVTEIAEGLSLIDGCDDLIGREVNLAFGRAYQVVEVAHLLIALCGKSYLKPLYIASRPGDVHALQADTALAKKVLGFKAKIPFEKGLKRYLNWFENTHQNVALLLEKEIINWKLANE